MVLEPANIRSLLIRAWRERWTDVHWGIHIKTVLPRYISGDIYQLSDCLLQQALIGSLPNNLILSYLRHSLASQIVSFGGVIESISKYDGLKKPYCVHALLDLMKSIMKNVNCKGKSEDCLSLSSSLVAGVKWLIDVMRSALEMLVDHQTAPEHLSNLILASTVLKDIIDSPFLLCLLYIGCREDTGSWDKCLSNTSLLKSDIEASTSSSMIDNEKVILLNIVSKIEDLKFMCSVQSDLQYNPSKFPICHVVFSLIMLEVMKHTTRSSEVITNQLILLQKFKGLSLCDLYLEMIRACFIGMSWPEHKKYQELKWVGFTYIKLPNVIHSIHKRVHGDSGYSVELLSAMQRMSSMNSLLETVDFHSRCNCLEYLFKELIPKVPQPTQASLPPSYDLLSERDAQAILAERIKESNVLKTLKNNETQGSPLSTPDLILRAQPTVIGILKTLANKNIDSVMTVLSLLISGKSRDLLLIAAASSGSLHIYAQKFVKLNEQHKDSVPNESSKMAANRAVVFDISFLLLCHIAQVYGIKVVVSEMGDTFVEKWVQENIPELGKVKGTIKQDQLEDSSKIEQFIHQFSSNTDSENKYVGSNFGEKCNLVALAIKELIKAAHHGQVVKQNIFDFLDKLCLHLCSLPICVTAWLCSYMQQLDGEESALVKEFLTYMQTKVSSLESSNSIMETFKDRSNLMFQIINEMSEMATQHTIVKESHNCAVPLTDLLGNIWQDIKKSNGLLSHRALDSTRDLLRLSGVKWFVSNFVRSALDHVFDNELQRAVDVTFGVFHLDIINCTFSHVIHTLPTYICGASSADLLCEPRTSALGRLTAMLLVECWVELQPRNSDLNRSSESNSTSFITPNSVDRLEKRNRKRSFSQRVMDNLQKDFLSSQRPFNLEVSDVSQDVSFFLSAVHNLFLLMARVSKTAVVSPVTHLIVFTLKELVVLPHTSTILSLVPGSLLSNLLPLLSSSLTFSYQELLCLASPDPFLGETKPLPLDELIYSKRKEKDIALSTAKLLCTKRNIQVMFQ